MKKIYFGTIDNNIVDNYKLAEMAKVVHGVEINAKDHETIRTFAEGCAGLTGEIKYPSTKMLLKHGHKFDAVKLYRDRHPNLSWEEAKESTNEFERMMKLEEDAKNGAEEPSETDSGEQKV